MENNQSHYNKYRNYQRKYAKDNSVRKVLNTKDYYRRKRTATLELLGGKCIRCGFSDYRALQVDHINGGGVKERKTTNSNYWNFVIRSVLNKENKFQLLCANCNWIKRFENNEVRKKL